MGDVSDIVRHITILKSNAEFKSVAQIRIDCHETVDLGGLGIHAAEFAALCGDIPSLDHVPIGTDNCQMGA